VSAAAGEENLLVVPGGTSRRGFRDRLGKVLDGIQGSPATRDW
jgi:hypothetical protein